QDLRVAWHLAQRGRNDRTPDDRRRLCPTWAAPQGGHRSLDRAQGRTDWLRRRGRRPVVEVKPMKAIGRHIILEMWGCQNLDSVQIAEEALRDMVEALDVNLLDLRVYPFSPVGVTGIAIVSESHLVIHTWPEHGYAAVDIFTCGAPRDPQDAVDVLRRLFNPERIGVMEINRGQLDLPEYKVSNASESGCATPRRTRTPAYSA